MARKPKKSNLWPSVLSDWLVNLSAGWIGAVVAIPYIFSIGSAVDILALTVHGLFGILALILAKKLREMK